MASSRACDPNTAKERNPDLDWLEGRTIMHKIVIGLEEPRRSLIGILQEMEETNATLRALTVKPTSAGRFEVVLQATELSSEDARELVGRLASHAKVSSAAIEHVLIS